MIKREISVKGSLFPRRELPLNDIIKQAQH